MASVPASEFQKNFGEWHEKMHQGPIEITKYGKPTAYLISSEMFHQLWQRFRVSLPVEALSESEVNMVMQARVETDEPYDLADLPEIDDEHGPSSLNR